MKPAKRQFAVVRNLLGKMKQKKVVPVMPQKHTSKNLLQRMFGKMQNRVVPSTPSSIQSPSTCCASYDMWALEDLQTEDDFSVSK